MYLVSVLDERKRLTRFVRFERFKNNPWNFADYIYWPFTLVTNVTTELALFRIETMTPHAFNSVTNPAARFTCSTIREYATQTAINPHSADRNACMRMYVCNACEHNWMHGTEHTQKIVSRSYTTNWRLAPANRLYDVRFAGVGCLHQNYAKIRQRSLWMCFVGSVC